MDYPKRQYKKEGEMTKKGYVVGRGTNKKVIPPEEVEKLAALWCTYNEMADWFEIPVETLKYNFRDEIAKGRSKTKQALRRAQIGLALNGNVAMLIWLGKNILGQSDKPEESDSRANDELAAIDNDQVLEVLRKENESSEE